MSAPARFLIQSAAIAAAGSILGFLLPSFYAGLVTLCGLYALVTIGLNLFMGYAGQVSLGQAAFLGVGAYTSAVMSVKLGVTPWLGTLAGAALSAVVAYLVSFVALRLREHYLALATLALGIVVNVVFNNWEYLGGSSGFNGIPGFTLFGHTFNARAYAVLAWILVAAGAAFANNLVASPYGRALIALGSSELGSASLGIDSERLKRQVFVLSAVYAGIAGGVYASYFSYIDPTSFGFLLSVNFVLMSVIGGLRSVWGAVVGAAAVVALGQLLSVYVPAVIPSARGDFQSFFFGAILIAILIRFPEGLISGLARARTQRVSSA
ncbi:MAG: branched-chain amino acid ABC transporter permease [Candidatus Eremiobacteraeota bacterium]|nr:branched-chain amino acid ABC transporter permease [Candidatus Eremiobacteraeota bacterium]MBV8355087.1 branched-chain amino acid ABC transporter permease [Candidatus Eremiobacteraeota bacterium]